MCHKSLFQQPDTVKKQIDYKFPTLWIFFYTKHIRHIKPIDYACKFVLDEHFVMRFLQISDMTSN